MPRVNVLPHGLQRSLYSVKNNSLVPYYLQGGKYSYAVAGSTGG